MPGGSLARLAGIAANNGKKTGRVDSFSDVNMRPVIGGKPVDFRTKAHQCRYADRCRVRLAVPRGQPDKFSQNAGTGFPGKHRPAVQLQLHRFLCPQVCVLHDVQARKTFLRVAQKIRCRKGLFQTLPYIHMLGNVIRQIPRLGQFGGGQNTQRRNLLLCENSQQGTDRTKARRIVIRPDRDASETQRRIGRSANSVCAAAPCQNSVLREKTLCGIRCFFSFHQQYRRFRTKCESMQAIQGAWLRQGLPEPAGRARSPFPTIGQRQNDLAAVFA